MAFHFLVEADHDDEQTARPRKKQALSVFLRDTTH